MNEGGENDQVLLWENNAEWLFFNLNDHQVGSREMFEGEKLPDPNRFDTPLTVVKNVAEVSIDVGKKRSPPNQKKGGNRSGEPKSGVDGGGVRRGESMHKIQIWTKRARRKKIRNMFKSLHALLPQLPGKAKGGNNLAQFSEAFTVKDMYKLATTEIMSLATPDDRY